MKRNGGRLAYCAGWGRDGWMGCVDLIASTNLAIDWKGASRSV